MKMETLLHCNILRCLLRAACCLLPAAAAAADAPWQSRCYAPTTLTKLGDYYFLVDCWHHRVLWNKTLDNDLAKWKTLDDDLAGPHSVASDGAVYLVEDTGRHAVRVYRPEGDGFRKVGQIDGLGKRPHRIRYDAPSSAFYVLSAASQHITKLVREGDRVTVRYSRRLEFLKDEYTRSMTIDGDAMVFVSGLGFIFKTTFRDDRFSVLAQYRVPFEVNGLADMNDVFHTDDGWWYVTATPRPIVRTRSLEALVRGEYEKLDSQLGLQGTPYYLSRIEGRYYVPQIGEYNGVVSFVHRDGRIADVRTVFDFGRPQPSDARRRGERPL